MFLEVICLTVEDVLAAQRSGANRVELVSDMSEDGLSPTRDTLEQVLKIAHIPVRVMLRFHNRGFVYSQQEIDQLIDWLVQVDKPPFDGYVIGALQGNGKVDEHFIQQIIQHTKKKLTFHRAIDYGLDILRATITLNQYPQIDCILTSGGIRNPIGQNLRTLQAMKKQSNKLILCGGGIKYADFVELCKHDLQAIHLGSLARHNANIADLIAERTLSELIKEGESLLKESKYLSKK